MQNVIVSFERLPKAVINAIESKYPHGFDHEIFEFVHPIKNEIYEAFRFSTDQVNYLIKLSTIQRKVDRNADWA